MRQVPENLSYLLIGEGRLARHLSFYLAERGLPFKQWNRKDDSTAELIRLIRASTHILLCINDDQIEPFYSQFGSPHQTYVHFSGSLTLPHVLGFHPLMSFGNQLYDLQTYEDIHFTGAHEESLFRECFPGLKNTYSKISGEQIGLYHSLCVLSGNGTTLLWDIVSKEFEHLGLPEKALTPYLQKIMENIVEKRPGRWTGPWYRKDIQTIERNKESLQKGPLGGLYSELEKLSTQAGHQNEKRP